MIANEIFYLLVLMSVLGFVAIFIISKIRKDKKAEQILRSAKQERETSKKLQAILNTAVDGIITINEKRIIQSFNPAAEKLFGYLADEVIGQNINTLMPSPYKENHDSYVKHYLTTGKKKIIGIGREVAGRRKDGSIFPMFLSVGEAHIDNQRLFTGIARDITELKKVEKMKNEFVSTVSHELRTPLTSIRGSLGLIAGGVTGKISDKAKQLVDIALNNCERLVRLINDILNIEKIEAGKMDFKLNPLKLMPVVEQAIEANRAYGKHYKVELVIKEALPDVVVNASHDHLMQVLANLISNAVKFSPSGSNVYLSVLRHEEFIRVAIRDCGPGIPEEFRKRIFQKFSQVDSSDKRQKGGTGLGLSIAKAIIEKMGGEIGFETEINKGTTFFFDLPEWQNKKEEG